MLSTVMVWGDGPRLPGTHVNVPLHPPQSGYALENAFGDLVFDEPVTLATPPGETNRLFVVERKGRIMAITNFAAPTKHLFLDVRGSTDSAYGEAGLLGLAFHPGYATNGYFYVYRTRARLGLRGTFGSHNQLTRLNVFPTKPNHADPQSELDLIVQLDQSSEHNGGDLHFGPDGYLYLALGDAGPPASDFIQTRQPIDKNLFGGILRIDVDSRPEGLPPNPHPSVTDNYAIPPDNPFVGVTMHQGFPVDPQEVRTEFYAIGFRNPWRFTFDPVSGLLYCGDVGGGAREEVDIVVAGGNYGWPYLEAELPTAYLVEAPPDSGFRQPLYIYPHGYATNEGRVIIGGRVYRGTAIPQLEGAYLFADNVLGHIWALRHQGDQVTEFFRLTADPGISTFGIDPRGGEILIANVRDGRVKRLRYVPPDQAAPFPTTLAETGIFADLETLTPAAGVLPYELNVPFWSDHAIKSRWFTIPDPARTIGFQTEGNWLFPEGTIWIKHFELELTNGWAASRRRLETRLLVKHAEGVYGVTYRWGDSITNAFLVADHGADEHFVIHDQDQVRTQKWHYPTRSECLLCHSGTGGSALGFNTVQLNRSLDPLGTTNQLELLSAAGYFSDILPAPDSLRTLSHPTNTAAPLEERLRSYLAVNCSQCHHPSSWTGAGWDGRFTTPTHQAGLINGSTSGTFNGMVIPGASSDSVLFQRISTPGLNRMPPIASSEFDTNGLALVREWIDTLPTGAWTNLDIGNVARPGSASISDDLLRVHGSGPGLGTEVDSFHFLARPLTHDGQIAVRIDHVSQPNPSSQAGIMLRETLTPSAPYAALVLKADVLQFWHRAEPLATSVLNEFPAPATSLWLRLLREGSNLSAWSSSDGLTWTHLTTVESPLANPIWMGLVAAGGPGLAMNNALFSELITLDVTLQAHSDLAAPALIHLQALTSSPVTDIDRITFLAEQDQIGTVTTPPYELVWSNAWSGTHSLRAQVFDRRGAAVTTKPVTLQVSLPAAGAVFADTDTATRGDWIGIYGTVGTALPVLQTNLPTRIVLTNEPADTLAWPHLDSSLSALQFGAGRLAGAWVHPSPWTLDLTLQDGFWYRLSLYFVDESTTNSRVQTIELIDPETDAILDSRVVADFSAGTYVSWIVRGAVRVRIGNDQHLPVVLSGLFLDLYHSEPVPIELTSPAEDVSLLGPATLLLQAEILEHPLDVRSVEFLANGKKLGEAAQSPYEYLWLDAWPGLYEVQARSLNHFDVPAYSEPVSVTVRAPATWATFLGADTTTLGNWRGIYGQDGVVIAAHATNLPAYAEVSFGSHHMFVNADFVAYPTALQRLDTPLGIAATYVHSPTLTNSILLRDGQPHLLALYFMEWGFSSRTLSVRVQDQATGQLLDQRTISDLVNGRYLTWAVQGALQIDIHLEVGANAILNGIFFGPVVLPVNSWRALHFSPAELEQPAISGDGADVDEDGLPNLLEHLLGLDPKTASTENPFQVALGDGYLLFTLDLARGAWDTTYSLQGSPDLSQWTSHTVQELQQIEQEDSYRVLLRADIPVSAFPQYFFRWGAQRR